MRRARAGWAPACCALTTAAILQTALAAQTPELPADVVSLLTKVGAFTPADLTALQSGRVITRTESSPQNLEASVVTAVRIATTKERALDYFNLLVSYVDGQVTVGYGTFRNPPREADALRLTLDASDVADLRACHPGACEMRMGAATVGEVAQAVDWRTPDATDRGSAWARRTLAGYADDYLKRGNAALAGYNDLGTPIDLQEQWRSMIGRSAALVTLAPSLDRYLLDFDGAAAPSEATAAIYWDKQRLTGLSGLGASLQRKLGEELIRQSAERLLSAMKQALEQ